MKNYNVADKLFFPYSSAKNHFIKAYHATEWKGRTIHLVVGVLECIPVVNYLVVLVELAVLHVFAQVKTPPKKVPKLPKQLEPLPMKFDQFTAWIDEQLGVMAGWKITDNDTTWVLRIRPLRIMLEGYKGQIEAIMQDPRMQGYDFSKWKGHVVAIQTNLDNRNAAPKDLYNLVDALAAQNKILDQGRQKFLEGRLRAELAKIPAVPTFKTWDDYFNFLGITHLGDQIGASKPNLPKFGITNLQDLETLQLNRFRPAFEEIKKLVCCVRFGLDPAVLEQKIAALTERLQQESGQTIAIVSNTQPLLSTIATNLTNFTLIEKQDKKRQIGELHAYVIQIGNFQAWTALKAMGIQTLSQHCVTNQVTELSSLYEIGATYGN